MTRKWQTLLIVSFGSFMGSLDVFIVNVAFPASQRDFGGTDLAVLLWALNAYAIVFAAFLVPAGGAGALLLHGDFGTPEQAQAWTDSREH
jgi:MFS family permease